MTKKELEKLYEDGKFYKVYKIALKVLQEREELEQENKEFKWVMAGYVTDLNKLERENKKLKEDIEEYKTAIDSVYEIVEMFEAESPAQKEWKKNWLKKAGEWGC